MKASELRELTVDELNSKHQELLMFGVQFIYGKFSQFGSLHKTTPLFSTLVFIGSL